MKTSVKRHKNEHHLAHISDMLMQTQTRLVFILSPVNKTFLHLGTHTTDGSDCRKNNLSLGSSWSLNMLWLAFHVRPLPINNYPQVVVKIIPSRCLSEYLTFMACILSEKCKFVTSIDNTSIPWNKKSECPGLDKLDTLLVSAFFYLNHTEISAFLRQSERLISKVIFSKWYLSLLLQAQKIVMRLGLLINWRLCWGRPVATGSKVAGVLYANWNFI